jgi:hypothetical protein
MREKGRNDRKALSYCGIAEKLTNAISGYLGPLEKLSLEPTV